MGGVAAPPIDSAAATKADRQLTSLPRRRSWRRRDRIILLGLAAPALIVVGGFVLYPIYLGVQLSLHSAHTFSPSGAPWVGLKNYTRLFNDPQAGSMIMHTYVRAVGGVVPSYLLGLAAAVFLNRRLKFISGLRVLALLPFVIAPPVALHMWLLLLDPLYGVPAGLGFHIGNPLLSSSSVWPTLLGLNMWGSFPFYTILLLAALQRIPTDQYEAAAVDGASSWRCFWHVTMPGLRSVSLVALTVHFILSFQEFNLVYITTGGGPLGATQTLPVFAYQQAFGGYYSVGYAAAITIFSAVLMLVTLGGLALILVVGRLIFRSRLARSLSFSDLPGRPRRVQARRARRISLSQRRIAPRRRRRWRTLRAYIGPVLIGLFAVAPMLFILTRSFDGEKPGAQAVSLIPDQPTVGNYTKVIGDPSLYHGGNPVTPPLALTLVNSVIVTAAVTTAVVVLSALAGYGLSRAVGRLSRGIGLLLIGAQLVPQILLVFPLYEFLASLSLINSREGQIVATTALFIPIGTLLFKVFFDNSPRELEEAAMLDGCGVLRRFAWIAARLARPAAGAVAAYTMINSWNEFLYSLTFVTNGDMRTFPGALQLFVNSIGFQESTTPAMQAIYIVVPIVITAFLLSTTQRSITAAYEGGAGK